MDKLKPVAWHCERNGQSVIETDCAAGMLQGLKDGVTVTPLYALPEGYAIVPVEKIKEAVFDGFMASGEGYNGEHCGRLDSEEQAREIADNWVKAKLKAAQEEG